MTPNPVWNHVPLLMNDAPGIQVQNTKTVECRLRKVYGNLAVTEANIEMFNILIKKNLATKDVTSFVKKQAIHKRVSSKPDPRVQHIAMRSKLYDACAQARKLRLERDTLKRRLARKYETRKSVGRRVLDGLVRDYRSYKEAELQAKKKKIMIIQQNQEVEKEITSAPPGTAEILSMVNIFSDQQHP